MAPRPEANEPAVDELKRRARRRLIGAIVLALAAAVILPLLLESDPKPLGDDVSIKIPPIDNGKFINPLSPEKPLGGATPDAAGPGLGAAAGARKAIIDAERRVFGQTVPPAPPAAPPARQDDAKTVASAPPAAETNTVAKAEPQAVPPDLAAPGAGFVVQLGAFADAQAATDLAARLKAAGFPAYTEAGLTSQGSVQRVRIGPFASREAADTTLARVKAAGYSGAIVAPK